MEQDAETVINQTGPEHQEYQENRGSNPYLVPKYKTMKRDCRYYFMKLDYEILKPLLIYKYEYEEMHKQDDYVEFMMSDNNMMGSVYSQMN